MSAPIAELGRDALSRLSRARTSLIHPATDCRGAGKHQKVCCPLGSQSATCKTRKPRPQPYRVPVRAGEVPQGRAEALRCEPGSWRASLWPESLLQQGGEAAWLGRGVGPALQGLLSPVQEVTVLLRTTDSHQTQRHDAPRFTC